MVRNDPDKTVTQGLCSSRQMKLFLGIVSVVALIVASGLGVSRLVFGADTKKVEKATVEIGSISRSLGNHVVAQEVKELQYDRNFRKIDDMQKDLNEVKTEQRVISKTLLRIERRLPQ